MSNDPDNNRMRFYPEVVERDIHNEPPPCSMCGKDDWSVEEEVNGYGIYLGRWCDDCRPKAMGNYRCDIYERYEAEEDIG